MTDRVDQLIEHLKRNPPDWEEQYGAGTSGEKAVAKGYLIGLNMFYALYHEPKEQVVHPLQQAADGSALDD